MAPASPKSCQEAGGHRQVARGVPRTPPLQFPLQALAGSGLAGLEGRAAADPLTEHLCTMVDKKRESF